VRLVDHPDPRLWWQVHLVGVPLLLCCLLCGGWSMWGAW
jgi:hypothetical protein